MKRVLWSLFVLCALQLMAAGELGSVNILDYKSDVIGLGTEQEDWQPAIQKAVAKAYETTYCVYFPAGVYKIQKAVDLWRPFTHTYNVGLTIRGDGRFASVIQQNNPKENCINWTSHKYEECLQSGTIDSMSVIGGDIGLNIKWHSNFTLTHCYVASCRIGVYAECWSNRFIDMIIRHCSDAGFVGCNHFNDVTIRDGYYSRCGTAIRLGHGARGVRVTGIGIENTVRCAIEVRGSMAIAITECYFEGNAMTPVKDWPENASIVLDQGNQNVSIRDCIFRGTAENSGHIVIGSGENIVIENNLDQLHKIGTDALVMLATPMNAKNDTGLHNVRVQNNTYCYGGRAKFDGKIEYRYFTRDKERFDNAVANGCVFEGGESYLRVLMKEDTAKKAKTDAVDFE